MTTKLAAGAPVYRQESTGKFGWIRYTGSGRDRQRAFVTGEQDVSTPQLTKRDGCRFCFLLLEHSTDRCNAERVGDHV